MRLVGERGQGEDADRQQSPWCRIGSRTCPVLGESVRESLLEGVLVMVKALMVSDLVGTSPAHVRYLTREVSIKSTVLRTWSSRHHAPPSDGPVMPSAALRYGA